MPKLDLDTLLQNASARGIHLWVDGNCLHFRGPLGAMTTEIREGLAKWKSELLASLGGPAYYPRGEQPSVPILRHYHDYWRQMKDGEFDIGFINGPSFVAKLSRALDPDLLKSRAKSIVSQHSILRARVEEKNEQVRFVFDQPHDPVVRIIDLTDFSGAALDAAAKSTATDLVWEPFDTNSGPMLRVFGIRLSANEHLVGLVVHHFICDEISLEVLLTHLLNGPMGEPRPLQYSDYILAMNEWIDGIGAKARMEFWRKQLSNAPATRLPPDFEPNLEAHANVNIDRFSIQGDITKSLRLVASQNRTTLFTLLLAAKMFALSYLLETSDIVVLVQQHNRNSPLLRETVGAITERLHLRVQILSELSFEGNLNRVQEALMAAHANEVPTSVIERQLADWGASNIAPAINFKELASRSAPRTSGCKIEPFEIEHPRRHGSARKHAAHWMDLNADRAGIHGSIGYSNSLYRRESIAEFLRLFERALKQIAADPHRRVSAICSDSLSVRDGYSP